MSKVNKSINKVFAEHKRNAERAKVTAINRASKSAVSRTIKFIRQAYQIKAKTLKEAIKHYRATRGKPKAKVISVHKPISLTKFGKPRQNKTGTAVKVNKGEKKTIKSAFVATMPSTHEGVFKRKKKSRLPIKELYGPSTQQLLSSEKSTKKMLQEYRERFVVEFGRAIKRFTSK